MNVQRPGASMSKVTPKPKPFQSPSKSAIEGNPAAPAPQPAQPSLTHSGPRRAEQTRGDGNPPPDTTRCRGRLQMKGYRRLARRYARGLRGTKRYGRRRRAPRLLQLNIWRTSPPSSTSVSAAINRPKSVREPAGNTVAPRSINRAFRIARGLEHQDANSLHPLLLLRASSAWPFSRTCCRAPYRCDEFAPPHHLIQPN